MDTKNKENEQPEAFVLNVIPPRRIAHLVEEVGVAKVGLPTISILTLAVLAGAFIAFGAMFYTVVITGSELGFGPTKLLGGVAFSVGLILVIIGGAELFTGNSLIVLALAQRKISLAALLKNWALVYVGNFAGALGMVLLVHFSGVLDVGGGAVAETARIIAESKVLISPFEAFLRGVLCNILVCLAIWMCFAAYTVVGKILVMIFPISAFVALGFEHSVANMYVIPLGAMQPGSDIGLSDFFTNLVPVSIGNIVGGGALVGMVYWLVYLRSDASENC